jgi:hypothetical protein
VPGTIFWNKFSWNLQGTLKMVKMEYYGTFLFYF